MPLFVFNISHIKNKFYLISSVLIVTIQSTYCQSQLENYLTLNGYSVDKNVIKRDINYFLDTRFNADNVFWHQGDVTLPNGQSFDSLKLKFNTIKNALYVNTGVKHYRFSTTALTSFKIHFNGQIRYFENGYGIQKTYQVVAKSRLNIKELTEYLMEFNSLSEIVIDQLSMNSKTNEQSLSIDISTFGEDILTEFKQHLNNNSDIYEVDVISELADQNERTFFEVLHKTSEVYLLKLNTKKNLSSGTVSLVNQSNQVLVDDEMYFLSGSSKKLVPISLNKTSVQSALLKLGIPVAKEFLTVRNERKLIDSLIEIQSNNAK
ncbi:hypothetical protein [Reichenbachiella sp.]|uniref:hypothetical protein n=1 Tax=Reichenbachiella sp. TaxID=2184521 RepID=UPI003BB14F09